VRTWRYGLRLMPILQHLIRKRFEHIIKACRTYNESRIIRLYVDLSDMVVVIKDIKNTFFIGVLALFDIIVTINLKVSGSVLICYVLSNNRDDWKIELHSTVSEYQTIPSMASVSINAHWLEREVFDMYGIQSPLVDSRRLLTDYGFEGFPLRKDFPLIGYIELRFDDELKHIVYEPVEMAQEYREFYLRNP
jgi:NADH-quinone oxidoreductase subunit C